MAFENKNSHAMVLKPKVFPYPYQLHGNIPYVTVLGITMYDVQDSSAMVRYYVIFCSILSIFLIGEYFSGTLASYSHCIFIFVLFNTLEMTEVSTTFAPLRIHH